MENVVTVFLTIFLCKKTYKHFKLIYLNNVQLLFEVKQLLNHRPVLFWVDHQDSATLFDEVTHLALQLEVTSLDTAKQLIEEFKFFFPIFFEQPIKTLVQDGRQMLGY